MSLIFRGNSFYSTYERHDFQANAQLCLSFQFTSKPNMAAVSPSKIECQNDECSFTEEALSILRLACEKTSTHGSQWYNILSARWAKVVFLVVMFLMQTA